MGYDYTRLILRILFILKIKISFKLRAFHNLHVPII